MTSAEKPPRLDQETTKQVQIDQSHSTHQPEELGLNEIRGVAQKEYGVTSAEDECPIIGTIGLGPCVAVTVYDSINHIAGIAHVDATTDLFSLGHLFQDVSKNYRSEHVHIAIYGGNQGSDQLVKEIERTLKILSVTPEIIQTLTFTSLAIDSRSGHVLENVRIINFSDFMSVRLMSAGIGLEGSPLCRSYNGRKK
jgi:hypothetical protein